MKGDKIQTKGHQKFKEGVLVRIIFLEGRGAGVIIPQDPTVDRSISTVVQAFDVPNVNLPYCVL